MSDLLKPTEAMARLGYSNKQSFLRTVRENGIPCIKINRRVIRFDPVAIDRYLKKREVGR
jgi:hypothetical protein